MNEVTSKPPQWYSQSLDLGSQTQIAL